jgi:hypothetical protein
MHSVQYSEDGSQAYVITEAAPTPASPAGTTSVAVITQGTAVAVTPTPVTGFTGQFDSLVLDPDTLQDRALLFTTETDTKGTTTTHVAIIDTSTATQTGPAINLAGQPADSAVIWSPDGTRATLITTGLDKLGATTTTLTTIDVARTTQT